MKYSKRIVSFILIFAILSSFFVVFSFASQGDIIGDYTDSGLGWWCKSDYYIYNSGSFSSSSVKLYDGSAIAFIAFDGSQYTAGLLSTVEQFTDIRNGGGFSAVVDGNRWYCRWTMQESYISSSYPVVRINSFSDSSYIRISTILNSAGVTFVEPSPPVPTPDRTIYNINDSPFIFSSSFRESATPGGQTTISVLDASYPALSDGVYGIVDTEDYYAPWTTYQYCLYPSSVPSQYAVVENTSISSTGNRALHISGTYNFSLRLGDGSGSSYDYLYPQMCYLYINGNLFQLTGSSYDSSLGLYTVDSYVKTDSIGDVSLIGIVGSFNSSVSRSSFLSSSRLDFYVESVVHDNLTYTMIPDSDTTTEIPVAPTPGPEVAETFEPVAPYIPQDYSSVVPDIPDNVANQDGSFTRSIWDLIVALVAGSWSVTTGIVTNVFDGVSGIISGIVSIPQFFDYLSKDNPDGVWGINSSDFDSNLWGV